MDVRTSATFVPQTQSLGRSVCTMTPEEDRPTFDAGSHRGHVDNVARFLSEHLPKQTKMPLCRIERLPLEKMCIYLGFAEPFC